MFRSAMKLFMLTAVVCVASGCGGNHRTPTSSPTQPSTPTYTSSWKSEPPSQISDNPYFSTQLSADCGTSGCKGFMLVIRNKTNKNLELNWNKTLYITGGQTSGGLMYDGVVYKDRNNPRPPDIVFPNGSLSKFVLPSNRVEFMSASYANGWYHNNMPQGENGVFLTMVVDGKEISEKLTVVISVARTQAPPHQEDVSMPMPAENAEPDRYATRGWTCKVGYTLVGNKCQK